MIKKRFKLAFDNYDGWAIFDTTGEYNDDEDYIDWLSGQKAVDVLNHFAEENEQLKKENYELKQKNRGWRRYCESQIRHIDFIEKVLENIGYSVVFDNEKQKWRLE